MPEIVLQATDLAKAFAAPAGPLSVLSAVSLEVRAGESVSIRGSSGSGKTTLLQLLGGLDVPDAGEVRVACEGALVAPRRRLGRGVGFVFQNYQLMPELTALENVALAARADHLPAQLSGGECQRVALARALVNRPAVLLADEPTGNLDERTAEEIMRLLLDVVAARGLALVLVTHSREFAERASRRLVLSGGVLSPA